MTQHCWYIIQLLGIQLNLHFGWVKIKGKRFGGKVMLLYINPWARYKLNKHKLQDGTLVKTAGRTYGEIVEEHLHRNPSLETSKSSVELEQRNR